MGSLGDDARPPCPAAITPSVADGELDNYLGAVPVSVPRCGSGGTNLSPGGESMSCAQAATMQSVAVSQRASETIWTTSAMHEPTMQTTSRTRTAA